MIMLVTIVECGGQRREWTHDARTTDRAVDVTPAAVDLYLVSLREHIRQHQTRVVDADMARREIERHIRASSVDWSGSAGEHRQRTPGLDLSTLSPGQTLRARRRDKDLELDVESTLIVEGPAHVRCIHVRTRHDPRSKTGAGERDVRDLSGAKIGRARHRDGRLEYRSLAPEPGRPAPPWGPLPDHVRVLARDLAARGDDQMLEWITRQVKA